MHVSLEKEKSMCQVLGHGERGAESCDDKHPFSTISVSGSREMAITHSFLLDPPFSATQYHLAVASTVNCSRGAAGQILSSLLQLLLLLMYW